MDKMNPKVDRFLRRAPKWQKEMEKLRQISLDCGLGEELKWGKPCYTFQDSNIVIIQGFKEFCVLMFPKGASLKDRKDILKEFAWQAARRIPFTSAREIVEMERVLKAYIREAMEAEKPGMKLTYRKASRTYP